MIWGSGALFVGQPVCREVKFEELQTDGKERRRKTLKTGPQPPFYSRWGGPSLKGAANHLSRIEGDGLDPISASVSL